MNGKIFYLVFLSCIYLFNFIFVMHPVQAAMRITPNRFEFKVKENDKRRILTGSLNLVSGYSESKRFKVNTEYFEISEDYNVLLDIKENPESSLVKHIRFNPREFTIQPGEQQTIRFTIVDVQDLPDGELRSILFMKDMKTKIEALGTGKDGINASMKLVSRIGIPIYVDKGHYIKEGKINSLVLSKIEQDNYIYDLKISSNGNSRIRIHGTGYIEQNGKLIDEFAVESRAIMAGTTTSIRSILNVDKLNIDEKYTIRFDITYTDHEEKEHLLTIEDLFSLNDVKQYVATQGNN